MSDLTRAESARVNGAKSKGPVTEEGKAKAALNSVTHGMSAKTLILQNENPEQFAAMLASYTNYLAPSNPIEMDLVSDMVAARWRLRRIWRYETAMIDIEMDVQAADFEKRFVNFDETLRGGAAFRALADQGKASNTALRYDIHLSRTFRQTLALYHRIAKRTQLGA